MSNQKQTEFKNELKKERNPFQKSVPDETIKKEGRRYQIETIAGKNYLKKAAEINSDAEAAFKSGNPGYDEVHKIYR